MIAAYQRISRADGDLGKDGKDKSNSIENQKELIQRYISCKESLQNVPVMDFVDDGYTGSNFDRPGFQQMMDGVRNGKIDTIIVKDLSVLAVIISVWANTWSRFSPCWVSGSLLSTITMTAIIIKVQRWEWMWSSVIW